MNKEGYEYTIKEDKDGCFLRARSSSAGKHFSDFRTYTKRYPNGQETQVSLNKATIEKILDKVKIKSLSECFVFEVDENGNQELNEKNNTKIQPDDIMHKVGEKELSFTSTGDKLDYHWPIFKKLSETGYSSIIRATMTLHQVCSSHCQFCSTINRNKKDSISLEDAKNFVNELYFKQAKYNKLNFKKYNDQYNKSCGSDIRLRGLILSGGGQPNLWPHFEEFVDWLSDFDIDLGLITNGFPKKAGGRAIDEKIYSNFKWIRLSITPEDASPFYPNQRFDLQHLPDTVLNGEQTFGLSYVYGPWTSNDILQRLHTMVDPWNVAYVRLLTDCNLGRNEQLKAHRALSEKLFDLGIINNQGISSNKMFHQLKYHGTRSEGNKIWENGQCYLQSYNVFWDTTGHEENGKSFCYPCDSVTVLADDESDNKPARGFEHSKWGTVTNDEVGKLYNQPLKAFFDPRENCSACLFMKNNTKVKELVSNLKNSDQIVTKNLPEHLNFP